ncbi:MULTISPECIES: MarR family EPS-associated transcriptional regulator [Sphingobium]|uniref:EPS-associated MarR family transcriptional regulator n=1 Tax=Sphingobium lignivorans TaxID=2735886 RepID=A0ABR6NEF2_9SPHN|nr:MULTISPECIES: MarR family EPS-associated transcriptional regulator [Sphingobium]MBB5985662.1 EPS-associated MarR family transcriptional regulator [Sphingobium lignivorans]BAK66272.1 putative MarR family transcriptional regulator [Sphingobium sp. SYK-6]
MPNSKADRQRDEAQFRILRLIEKRPDASQREIAEELGVSLGAVNYCVRALLDKGHVKLANFKASKNKLGYVYVLTPEGIAHRANLAVRFIERKMTEYEAIKAELEQLQGEFGEPPSSGD